MNKYNHISSIPVDSIPKEEIKEAIKEWAEGNKELEKLLSYCYKIKLKTIGCHAGKDPYIDFIYEKNKSDKLLKIINTILGETGTQLLFLDGGNPFSGSEWYLPRIGLGVFDSYYKKTKDEFFSEIYKTLKSKEEKKLLLASIIDFMDFLIGKNADLMIRVRHFNDEEYVFSLEKMINKNDIKSFDELNNLLTKAGMTLAEKDMPVKIWEVKEKSLVKLDKRVNSILNYITNNYNDIKNSIVTESSSLLTRANLKREELIRNGKEDEFDNWLKQEYKKMNNKEDNSHWLPIGLCLGISIGTAIGALTNDMSLWMSMGISIGLCLGLVLSNDK